MPDGPPTTRTCPSPDCGVQLPRNMYACRRHWFALPQRMRARINHAWKFRAFGDLARAQNEARAYLQRAWERATSPGPDGEPPRAGAASPGDDPSPGPSGTGA